MIVYHWTPTSNVSSILTHGLDPAFAIRSITPAVYLTEASTVTWARRHVAIRHAVDVGDLALIQVEVSILSLVHLGTGLHRSHARILPRALKVMFSDMREEKSL